MEKVELLQSPEKKEQGKNVTLHLNFLRHAHKAQMDPHAAGGISQSNLSKKGIEASRDLGLTSPTEENLKSYVSRFERSLETAENYLLGMLEKKDSPIVFSTRVRSELDAPHFSEKFITEYRSHFIPKPANFELLSPDEQEKIIEDMEAPAVEYWLDLWGKKFDEETESAAEIAERIAYYFSHFDRLVEKLNSGSQVELLNVTHKTTTEPFLRAVLKPSFQSMKEVGGPLNLLEGFEILIQTDKDGNKTCKVLFRDKEYEIDMARVQQLRNAYLKRKEKKI